METRYIQLELTEMLQWASQVWKMSHLYQWSSIDTWRVKSNIWYIKFCMHLCITRSYSSLERCLCQIWILCFNFFYTHNWKPQLYFTIHARIQLSLKNREFIKCLNSTRLSFWLLWNHSIFRIWINRKTFLSKMKTLIMCEYGEKTGETCMFLQKTINQCISAWSINMRSIADSSFLYIT